MDVQDGFIPGIYSYCDRWCEVCVFTSRCRTFANRLAWEASVDRHLKPVVDAPPLPQDVPPPPPRWVQECIDELNEAARQPLTGEEIEALEPRVAREHQHIDDRARGYSFGTAGCLQTLEPAPERDVTDPRNIVRWYCAFIPAKIYRALTGLLRWQQDPDDWPPDHDGSAKVALLTIERSRAAWIDIADRGLAPIATIEPFVSELGRLADDLERVFPNARAFVRPGLDEPDEVAKLAP